MAPKKTVVLFVEGLSAFLTDHLVETGQLPNLAYLKNNCRSGPSQGLPVPYETTGILSSMTGGSPGEYGVFSFWKTRGAKFFDPPELISSSDITLPFILDGLQSRRVALVNVFGTHPIKESDYQVVSYPMWRTLRSTNPDWLMKSLHREGIRYTHDVSILYTSDVREVFPEIVRAIEIERIKTILHLLHGDFDCIVATITLIERLSHFYWDTLGAEDDPREESPIIQAYRFLDAEIGRILQSIGADDDLLIFSEHGFGPIGSFVKIDDALAGMGFLDWSSPDPLKSIAREAPQGTHGVNLALRESFLDGWIDERDKETLLSEVMAFLRDMKNPTTGASMWERVVLGRDLYFGAKVSEAPDIIVLPQDERFVPFGEPSAAKRVDRHLQTGWHRRESRWFFKGKSKRFDADGIKTPYDVAEFFRDLASG